MNDIQSTEPVSTVSTMVPMNGSSAGFAQVIEVSISNATYF